MSNFKDDLELINYVSPVSKTFNSKDYEALLHDISETFGATVVGSNMRALGALIHLYAKDSGNRFAVIYSNTSDFMRALSIIRRENPLPPKKRKIMRPRALSRWASDIESAIGNEIDIREKTRRPINIPPKFANYIEYDEDGTPELSSILKSKQRIMKGLLDKDPEALEVFAELMIVAPEREEWV